MIVDLMRNDLGRVSAYGTVQAPSRPTVEPHPGLWHLVSHVQGRLRPTPTCCVPSSRPGSVTGAPKVQVLHVIADLELAGREIYTGAIGYASPIAGLELNVAIRTLELRDGRLWLGAGGGIVADSIPERELEEALVNARPIAAAVGTSVAGRRVTRATGCLGRRITPHSTGDDHSMTGQRAPAELSPGRSAVVFGTLLVRDGRAQALDAHLARLASSVALLYDAELPVTLAWACCEPRARWPASTGCASTSSRAGAAFTPPC